MDLAERNRLAYLEDVIEKDQKAWYRVGMALFEIRESKLYRETHKTFEDYCRERWDVTKSYVNYLIGSSEVVQNLTTIVVKPKNEAQARPLTKLKSPEQQIQVWEMAVETAPDGKVTAKHVQKVVSRTIKLDSEGRKQKIRKKATPDLGTPQEYVFALKRFFEAIQVERDLKWKRVPLSEVLRNIEACKEIALFEEKEG